MSESLRLAGQLIDEKPPMALIPRSVAPKNDLGIIKKLVNIVSPHNGSAPYGYAHHITEF